MNSDAKKILEGNDESAFRIAYLIAGYVKDTLTQQEHEELDDWVTKSMENQKLFEELTDPANIDKLMKWRDALPVEQALSQVKKKIKDDRRKRNILSIVLPYAAIILALGFIVWIVYYQIMASEKTNTTNSIANKIVPGGNKAALVLSNGKIIPLDGAGNIKITGEENVLIKKDGNTLNYQGDSANRNQKLIAFNTLTTPRGGEFKVVLPDGTKVWLNSESKLRYPTFFDADARNIDLSGEAYFEVSKDPMHPFIVKTGQAMITVLGTHFNVNAYTEDSVATIALLEGSVKINQSEILKPGEEAIVYQSGTISKRRADLEMSVAWKDGLFIFRGSSIGDIMKQVSRWYDADVSYSANISEHFNAIVPRDSSVNKLLQLLEGTGSVHFNIDNKKITVMK